MKQLLILLLILLGGCALFRPSVQSQLEPLEMTFVEGGTYLMGDTIEEENDDSLPLHEVTLPDFYIGTYEVTYSQYDAYARATGKKLPQDDGRGRGNRAVVYVNWYDALQFCNAYGYRLPTEQEWEFAARSGGKDQIFSGVFDPDSLDSVARHKDNSAGYTFSVGTKDPNDLGLYDMTGNVSEWIGDYYPFFKANPDSIEYYPLEERAMRVIRGGSFNSNSMTLRNYWRVGVLAEIGDHTIGFRCVDPIAED
ncbi:formylglycine-generating enzyme family protein [Rhodohalobacter halophilus]|uniref:formylglycine-generating enzyme family protein n=1 Tax=Rhodohalobacter halophilus TaxID=1812810 RepID=UPI000A006B33|nr:SUMF1/EgtB/PvdO family nonheme iron enzyme [Rhodohalobacter halophilus]